MKTNTQDWSVVILAGVFYVFGTLGDRAIGELLVYEPFDYTPGEILTGKGGAKGTTGVWNTFDTITGDGKTQDWFVHAEGTMSGVGLSNANGSAEPGGLHRWDGTVENLPTSGGYVGLWGADDWNDPDGANAGEPGRNLSGDIGLDPSVTATFTSGTTTWISYVSVRGWDRNEEHPNLVLATDPAPDGSRGDNFGGVGTGGSGFGTGGGPTRNNRTTIYPMFYNAGQYQNVNGAIPGNAYNQAAFEVSAADRMNWDEVGADSFFGPPMVVVMKLEWDAEEGGEDIVSVARFLETDELTEANFDALIAAQPNLSSANWAEANKPDIDQSQLDTLTFMGLKYFVDEIRLGTSFADLGSGGVFRPFAITEFVRDDVLENLAITFNSTNGSNYAVDFNLALGAGQWFEATDATGDGSSTTIEMSYADVRIGIGIGDEDPLPADLFVRVRDIAQQEDPNP